MIILECAALFVSHGGLCYLPYSPTEFISLTVVLWKGSDAETVKFLLRNSYTITVDHKKRCLFSVFQQMSALCSECLLVRLNSHYSVLNFDANLINHLPVQIEMCFTMLSMLSN